MERKCNIHYKITPNYWILFSSKASYNHQSSKRKTKQEETQIKSLACYHVIICLNSLLSQLSRKFVSFGYCSHPLAHPSCMELWHGCGEGEHYWGSPQTPISQRCPKVPPTLPGHRHTRQTLQPAGKWRLSSILGSQRRWKCPVLTRHPRGCGSAFSSQITQEGRNRDRSRAQRLSQTPSWCFMCRQQLFW